MDPSLTILIVTAILGLIIFGLIIAGFIIDQNRFQSSSEPPGPPQPTDLVCEGPGVPPLIDTYPSYTRTRPKSLCKRPLSSSIPPYAPITHPVNKSYRIRSIKTPVSSNHWLGQLMAGPDNLIMTLPYVCQVDDQGFKFGWPTPGTLTQRCPFNPTPSLGCEPGQANLFYNVSMGPSIKITGFGSEPLGCDLLDVDALIGTLVWQYRNFQVSRLQIPLAKGCPFVTVDVGNMGFALTMDFTYTFKPFNTEQTAYVIEIDASTGYLVVVSTPVPWTNNSALQYITVPIFTGIVRIGYYTSETHLQNLYAHHSEVPIESTIGAIQEPPGTSQILFEWATTQVNRHNTGLLMYALPHHNLINPDLEPIGPPINHPLMGPVQLVAGPRWILSNKVEGPGFDYPINPADEPTLLLVWRSEIKNVFPHPPGETVSWCQWLGSVGTLLLIGAALRQDIEEGLLILKTNLNALTQTDGVLAYDQTWNGIISTLGLNNCQGDGDQGNAFYENHIGQFGYLVYAYAVAGHFDPDFIKTNTETALLFARTIMNPYENDPEFPLWRNKDWYFGYSIASGLTPNQARGKNATDIGGAAMGYYGSYLLSRVLSDQLELRDWSLAMLGAEIASLQTYFQVGASSAVTVDPTFVEGTITQRGDTYYDYTVPDGSPIFPARHASMMIPLMKPLTLSSPQIISLAWATYVQPFMTSAIAAQPPPQAYGYANALMSVGATDRAPFIQNIVANRTIYLPYGSTWSSLLYWILTN